MRPSALLLLLASCTANEPEPSAPAPRWVYAPSLPAWQLGEPKGKFGRSQPPQPARGRGITGDTKVALRETAVWSVPGEPARAAVFGLEGTQPAIELIDVDAGRVLWRRTACVEPIVRVTASTIVCGGAKGVRGVGLDGQPKWNVEEPLVALTGPRIVVGRERVAIAIGADDGKELARVALPAGVELKTIVASCDGELFAQSGDVLQRIADVRGKPAIAW
ncbi:MAG: hypothetical protein H0V17_04335, partial [Deltaproteobacteria bacterium]|nr:hypothetical protein [Deltaproteobacteria bacterium]